MRIARLLPIALVLVALALPAAALPPVAAGATAPAASAPPAAPGAPAIAPFLCPEGGPNGGLAPMAMAKSAGRLLVLCADTESEEGQGIVASAVAIHEPGSATPKKPVFSTVSDALHLRVHA